jgi:hypothetical protein
MPRAAETRMNGDSIEKRCTECLEFKPTNDFHNAAHGLLGVTNKCKECFKERYAKDRERILAKQKKYYEENPDNRGRNSFKNHIKRNYNLTLNEYDQLAENGCMICGTPHMLGIDHDHDSNEVRGVLCRSCNGGLGLFKDSIDLLLKAASYLESKKASFPMPGIRPSAKP